MRASISGLGLWLPDRVRTNDYFTSTRTTRGKELARAHENERDPFQGARERRVADASMSSSLAEALAARAALEDAGLQTKDVDVVLSWALVPDEPCPPNATRVASLLGAQRARAYGVDSACASIISQIELASALIESGRANVVVVTQSELQTRATPDDHPAAPLVGDAASALVLTRSEEGGVIAIAMDHDASFDAAVRWVRADGMDAPWWKKGAAMIPGSADPASAERLAQQWVEIAARTIESLPSQAISVLAMPQHRPWLPGALCDRLGLPARVAPHTFEKIAHVGCCAVVANLLRARTLGLFREDALACLYAVGAGITSGAALVRITKGLLSGSGRSAVMEL